MSYRAISGSLSRLGLRLRFELKYFVGRFPFVFIPLRRLLRPEKAKWDMARPGMDLVVEGYPRSGNTYVLGTFRLWVDPSARLGHHQHVPGHVIASIRMRIPVLLLVRNPADCVVSEVIRDRHVTLRQALRAYISFHQVLLPYRSAIAIAAFEEATTDLDPIIRRLNSRYNTSFAPISPTADQDAAVFQWIERTDLHETGSGQVREHAVARPSSERGEEKKLVAARLSAAELQPLLSRANQLHKLFLNKTHDNSP